MKDTKEVDIAGVKTIHLPDATARLNMLSLKLQQDSGNLSLYVFE